MKISRRLRKKTGGKVLAIPDNGSLSNGLMFDSVKFNKGALTRDYAERRQYWNRSMKSPSDAKTRRLGNDGRLTPVGNTGDVKNASYQNRIGAPILQAFWKDPDFKAGEPAFYYVRVLEIPTPRWTVYDAKTYGVNLPDGVPTAIQESAYTLPVWMSSQ